MAEDKISIPECKPSAKIAPEPAINPAVSLPPAKIILANIDTAATLSFMII